MSEYTQASLYARSPNEVEPTFRGTGSVSEVMQRGWNLARASIADGGVMSVWVQAPDGEILWSAGEKWNELHSEGQE